MHDKLEEKRQELKKDFERRYAAEEQKLLNKNKLIIKDFDKIWSIQKIFDQLSNLIETKPGARFMKKESDLVKFLTKSFEELDALTKQQI